MVLILSDVVSSISLFLFLPDPVPDPGEM
jgi:hypothetical protein